MWLALLTAFFLGVRHCFEPDHLTALAQFAQAAPTARHGLRSGLLWGLGHGVSVLVLGIVLAAFWTHLPHVDAHAEQAVGVTLIVLSGWRLRALLQQTHSHEHRHEGGVVHEHAHHHDLGHVHFHAPTLTGLIHGAAGAVGVVALLSLVGVASPLALAMAFSLGALLAMGAFGWLAARFYASMSFLGWGRALQALTGLWGVALGICWLVT
jgi:hypothetical protein